MGLPVEKLEERRHYIGGSDAASLMGLSRWKTPVELWAEKTGLQEPAQKDSLASILGNRLEEVVAELFTEKTGKKIKKVEQTLFHPQHSFIGANVDRLLVDEDAGLECKTVAAWKAKDFESEELPPEHIIQAIHYMAVTGLPRWYVAALIGNQDFVVKVIERDEHTIGRLVLREKDFWDRYVIPGVMPKVTKRDDAILQALFPQARPLSSTVLDDKANQILETLDAMEQDRDNLDGQIEQMRNELKGMLRDHEEGISGLWRVTWKNQESTRLDSKRLKCEEPDIWKRYAKTSTNRVLRYSERED